MCSRLELTFVCLFRHAIVRIRPETRAICTTSGECTGTPIGVLAGEPTTRVSSLASVWGVVHSNTPCCGFRDMYIDHIFHPSMADLWKEIAVRKQAEQYARIPQEWRLMSSHASSNNVMNVPRDCGILDAKELHITEDFDATSLLHELAQGSLKSVEVVTAFCKRAAITQQLTKCLTEIFFTDAITRAEELDQYLQKNGRPMGPLHGLPVSIKDSFKVKGYDASVGVAGFCFKPVVKNSALVDLLLSLGAVLYCKTNVPLTMMALDSHNNVFGRVLNPANKLLTPGGSSGGEGALIAMRGSVLGVGTDVGGSIRIPAMCNGLVGVKPSHGRVPYAGQEGGSPEGASKLTMESTAGPIAHSVRDCETFLRAVGNGRPWLFDPDVLPQSWDQQDTVDALASSVSAKRPLRVGIVRTDGHVTPLPPIERLMEEVSGALRSTASVGRAVEIVDVDFAALGPQCLKTFNGIMSIDGGNTWFDHLATTGEPLSPWLQGRLRRRPQKPLNAVRELQGQKLELQTRMNDVWRTGGLPLDAIICPVAPHPVPRVDKWNTTNYTSAFNLLDCPAGVLPVRVSTAVDTAGKLSDAAPLNGWDKINKELWGEEDRREYVGSTLSTQVVAPKLMERSLVEVMSILETVFMTPKLVNGQKSKL